MRLNLSLPVNNCFVLRGHCLPQCRCLQSIVQVRTLAPVSSTFPMNAYTCHVDDLPRAFQSGFEAEPVMCQTINTTMANNCAWASCGEWCLTKTSGFCPQIHATVRRNGTDVLFENCTRSIVTHCPQVRHKD